MKISFLYCYETETRGISLVKRQNWIFTRKKIDLILCLLKWTWKPISIGHLGSSFIICSLYVRNCKNTKNIGIRGYFSIDRNVNGQFLLSVRTKILREKSRFTFLINFHPKNYTLHGCTAGFAPSYIDLAICTVLEHVNLQNTRAN